MSWPVYLNRWESDMADCHLVLEIAFSKLQHTFSEEYVPKFSYSSKHCAGHNAAYMIKI